MMEDQWLSTIQCQFCRENLVWLTLNIVVFSETTQDLQPSLSLLTVVVDILSLDKFACKIFKSLIPIVIYATREDSVISRCRFSQSR